MLKGGYQNSNRQRWEGGRGKGEGGGKAVGKHGIRKGNGRIGKS